MNLLPRKPIKQVSQAYIEHVREEKRRQKEIEEGAHELAFHFESEQLRTRMRSALVNNHRKNYLTAKRALALLTDSDREEN